MLDLRSPTVRYWALGVGAAVVACAILLAYLLGPWRDAYLEQKRAQRPVPPMSQFVPDGVTGRQNLAYGDDDRETLDVWFPAGLGATEALPVIVWVHGGGWIGGSKDDIAPYAQILASRGFTTIGVNYSLAPGERYPRQVQQLNTALDFVTRRAGELHVDPARILLAGDSGGAHIAAQLAAGITDPATADELELVPAVQPQQVAGLLLACGAFDLRALVDDVGGVVEQYVDAYLGTTLLDSLLGKASVNRGVTDAFPATWLTGGNADPLTPQVKAFAATLLDKGVDVETLFWPAKHSPPLGHEFQFDLGLRESQQVLDEMTAFARAVTAPGR